MLERIASYIDESKNNPATTISDGFEKGLQKAFEEYFTQKHKKRVKVLISGRGNKTYIFPWVNQEEYQDFVRDPDRFRREVVANLSEYAHATGHCPTCKGRKGYKMIGFRSKERKIITSTGEQKRFSIRMVQCQDCGEKFSLLPSFLPREKHFAIDVIGQVFQNILLFSQSMQAALQNLSL
ncbi:hypothetical protein KA005_67170, partial [bacterium]|nr:hypothetical protein [bacterium]